VRTVRAYRTIELKQCQEYSSHNVNQGKNEMKTINDYFDDLKKITGSDYATAKKLKIGKSSLSTIRSRGQMADETALKVADLLQINRTEVLIAAAMARSEGEVKNAWEDVSKHVYKGVMLGGVVALGSVGLAHTMTAEMINGVHCILCKTDNVGILGGVLIAVGSVLINRNRKNGSQENKFLPPAIR